jgi:hypothetical protein
MYSYEEYKDSNPEEKLTILTGEMIPLLATIRTYTDTIKYNLGANSQEIENWTNKIIEAVDNLEKLRGILIK